MKKYLVFVLVLSIAIVMCACGKSEAAKTADSLISAIGVVTLNSENAIIEAEKAVEALEQKDLDSIEGIEVLHSARADYEALVDASKIQAVEDAINAIGTVTTGSKNAIDAARTTYDNLESRLKNSVRNFEALTKAELDYEEAVLLEQAEVVERAIDSIGIVTLESEKAIADAQNIYNSASEAVQAKVKNGETLKEAVKQLQNLKEQQNAQRVVSIIEKIGEVNLDSGDAINAAQSAYDALTSSEKALVTNNSTLTSAKETFKALNEEELAKKLNAMKKQEDRITGISYYFPAGWSHYGDSWAADISCFIRPYIAIKDNYFSVFVVYNYTSYSWVFWTKMTVMADGQKFIKSYKYGDIDRDNGGGKVWENYTDSLDAKMLKAISESKETLVRFEGSRYYDDYTVTASEKQSMQQVLEVYDLLIACGYKES